MSIIETFFDYGIGFHTPKDLHMHTPEHMLKEKEMNAMDEKRLKDLERQIHEDPKGLNSHIYVDEEGRRHDSVFADRNEFREYDQSSFENTKWLMYKA